MNWWQIQDGKNYGPWNEEVVFTYIQEGKLRRETLLRGEAGQDVPAWQVAGMTPVVQRKKGSNLKQGAALFLIGLPVCLVSVELGGVLLLIGMAGMIWGLLSG